MFELRVQTGEIIALRLFDVAYSIDLPEVERLWDAVHPESPSRRSMVAAPATALAFDVPPVLAPLPSITLFVDGIERECLLSARFYDFGVVALSLRVPMKGISWQEFAAAANAVERSLGALASDEPWKSILESLASDVGCAYQRPGDARFSEDHLVALVRSWNRPVTSERLLEKLDLIPLLTGENRPLSPKAREELLKHRFSYYEDDLAVVTWDRAFVCEPRGDLDVVDILEVANAQFLECRYYDELLDGELPRMYELVRKARRGLNILSSRRFADLARRLYTLVAEVTELTEKAENVLRVTEDVHLARVYLAALGILRVPTVSSSVQRKLGIIRDTYTALFDEASGARGEVLELAIIILIVIEIGIALIRHVS
jgi:hypothetical protein